jgi:hypothetical protein
MMFSSNTFRSVLVLAAACNAVTSAINTVNLGDAEEYVILAKTGIATTATKSTITGDIGVSPITATAITGFDLSRDSLEYSTSAQITGKAYASDYDAPTKEALTAAVDDMMTAYTDAAGRPNSDGARIDLNRGNLGGEYGGKDHELTPGVYTFGTGVTIAEDIYFDGDRDEDSVFIIQTAGSLEQVAGTKVILENGARAENIFWQVATHVEVGAGAEMQGILLAKTKVDFIIGSELTAGRVLTQTACNLDGATIIESPISE